MFKGDTLKITPHQYKSLQEIIVRYKRIIDYINTYGKN